MNHQFTENQKYIDIYKNIKETLGLLYEELCQIHNSKTDEPYVINLKEQFIELKDMALHTFVLLIRNGFCCDKNGDSLNIEVGEYYFEENVDDLKKMLGNKYFEIIEPSIASPRKETATYILNEEAKEKIREEYKKTIQEELEDKVYQELKVTLTPDVCADIRRTHTDDVLNKMKEELRETVRQELKDELTESVKSDLRDEWSEQIRHELKSDMKAEVKDDIKNDIKKQVENEVMEQTRTEIVNNIKKEREEKGDMTFLNEKMAQNNETVKNIGNQNICTIFTFKYKKEEVEKEYSIKAFPVDFNMEKNKSISCHSLCILDGDDIETPRIFYKKDGPTSVHIKEINADVTIMTKWKNMAFSAFAYCDCRQGSLTKTERHIKPITFDYPSYRTSFKAVVGEGDNSMEITYYPLSNKNTEDEFCSGVVRFYTLTQEEYMYINRVSTFNLGNLGQYKIGGHWDNDIFSIDVQQESGE